MAKLIGNAIVGQSGGPTAAINATLSGVIRGAMELRDEGIVKTLYGMKNGIEGAFSENLVDLFDFFDDIINQPRKAVNDTRLHAVDRIFRYYRRRGFKFDIRETCSVVDERIERSFYSG